MLLPYSVSFQRVWEATLKAEGLGFDSVWISDHMQRQTLTVLECWTTISALAATVGRIRLGSLATCNSFRNPALLAKVVSTASQVSGGRVDLGIGVGYDEDEHAAYGYAFPPLKERVGNLSDSLKVIMALWKGSVVNFDGANLHLRGAICLPTPVAKPRVWVAGRSEAVLEAAASKGVYGVNVLPYSGTRENRRISSDKEIDEIAAKIGSYKGLRKSMYCGDGGVVLAQTRSGVSRRTMGTAGLLGISTQEMERRLRNLSVLYGTVNECETKLKALASAGFEELMLIFPGWQKGDYTSMKTFAESFIG